MYNYQSGQTERYKDWRLFRMAHQGNSKIPRIASKDKYFIKFDNIVASTRIKDISLHIFVFLTACRLDQL
jgi:hypothetical protein